MNRAVLLACPLLGVLLLLLWTQAAQAQNLITVDSTPPGASVFIDGKEQGLRGSTPLRLRLLRGQHKVLLELEGHKSIEQVINVSGPQRFAFKLSTLPARIEIKTPATNRNAQGAEIYIDGNLVGIVPVSIEVEAGRRLIEVRKSGHQPHTETIEVKAGELRTVWAQLQGDASVGALIVSSELPAEVLVDGQLRGSAPVMLDALSPGPHDIEVRSSQGGRTWRQTVHVQAGQRAQITASFTTPAAPPPPPAPAVSLIGRNPSMQYNVSAGGLVCVTPCSLPLPPGPVDIAVSGGGPGFHRRVHIPGGAATLEIQHFTRSRMIAGLVLVPLSMAFGIGTASSLVQACDLVGCRYSEVDKLSSGIVLGVHAGVFFLAGVIQLGTIRRARIEVR